MHVDVSLHPLNRVTMQFDIYRPKSRTDLYIFVPNGTSPTTLIASAIPQFGTLEFVKTREILPGQNLVGVSADEIINNALLSGFHIQGVKASTQVSEGGAALGGGILGASVGGPVGAIFGALLGIALAEHAKKVPDDL